jgi:hypothetical protein
MDPGPDIVIDSKETRVGDEQQTKEERKKKETLDCSYLS